jgi:hypothetical protein
VEEEGLGGHGTKTGRSAIEEEEEEELFQHLNCDTSLQS